MLAKLEKQTEKIRELNSELSVLLLEHRLTNKDLEWLSASAEILNHAVQDIQSTIESGKRLNKISSKSVRK